MLNTCIYVKSTKDPLCKLLCNCSKLPHPINFSSTRGSSIQQENTERKEMPYCHQGPTSDELREVPASKSVLSSFSSIRYTNDIFSTILVGHLI